MKRYDLQEVTAYWRMHAKKWRNLDRNRDPKGLANVCFNARPVWFNALFDYFERRTFLTLLGRLGPLAGKEVLDVGCGTGRWSALMADRGAKVTGIDLQAETLAENRKRIPQVEFYEMSILDLDPSWRSFDLATSVTVIQHIPYEHQGEAIAKVSQMIRPQGHLVVLEDVVHAAPHCFPNSLEDWLKKLARLDWKWVGVAPCCYFHLLFGFLDLSYTARSKIRSRSAKGIDDEQDIVSYCEAINTYDDRSTLTRKAFHLLLRFVVYSSYALEPIFENWSLGEPSHCGFLFQRP